MNGVATRNTRYVHMQRPRLTPQCSSRLLHLILLSLLPHSECVWELKVGALVAFDYAGYGPWPPHYTEILDSAVTNINNNVLTDGDIRISVEALNDKCAPKAGLISVVKELELENSSDRVDGFIGPGCSEVCKNAAYIVSREGFNVPMISYACTLDSLSSKLTYSTFARTVSSVGANAVPMTNLVETMKWERIGIIYRNINLYEEAAAKFKKTLEDAFGNQTSSDMPDGFKVVCYKVWYYDENHDDSKNDMKRAALNILDECRDEVRVFVILAYDSDVVQFLKYAHSAESFPFSECAFITLEVTSTTVDNTTRAYTRGLLSLAQKNPANSMFDELVDYVRTSLDDDTAQLDVYSATLYDSLLTYAMAAKQIKDTYFTANSGETDENNLLAVMELMKNGTYITEVITELPSFEGASGPVKFDSNADRIASIEVFQAQIDPETNTMEMVRIFDTDSVTGNLVLEDGAEFQWNDGSSDIPEACGPGRELCEEKDIQETIILVTIPIGVCLIAILIVLVVFVIWRQKQQRSRDRSLWKIRTSEVEFKDATQSGRLHSVTMERSMSRMSNNSDATLMHHGIVAYYRNNPVFLKNLNTDVKSFCVTEEIIQEFKQVRELTHQNLNPYIGACVELPDNFFLASLYLRKGSLQDILCDSNLKLDTMFKMSFIFDICRGMQAIHNSPIKYHGRLKSCNCVVDAHWVLKITDYGLVKFLSTYSLPDPIKSEDGRYYDLLWTAPELLRSMEERGGRHVGSQKGDIFSFAVILTEIMATNTPYGDINCSAKEIVMKVKEGYNPPFRPDMPVECSDGMSELIAMCWDENPVQRPDFPKILGFLQAHHPQKQRSITDRMIKMMEQYTDNLEDLVAERSEQLAIEKEKADNLLCRMLPQPIAEKLKQGEPVAPQAFDEVTIYFSDIVGFTDLSGQSTPFQVVDLLNDLYSLFDGIVERHDVYKVETIGDAYMVVSGLPVRNGQRHVAEIANMSLDFLNSVKKFKVRHKPEHQLLLRIGMHTGSVCAGVVGLKMPRYCLFGDTVNTASRMESNGLPLKIHMSEAAFTALDKIGGYHMECRGEIAIKGKGMMKTWFLAGKEFVESSILISAPPSPELSQITNVSKNSIRDLHRNGFPSRNHSISSFSRKSSKRSNDSKSILFLPQQTSISLDSNEIYKNNSSINAVENQIGQKATNGLENGHFLSSNA